MSAALKELESGDNVMYTYQECHIITVKNTSVEKRYMSYYSQLLSGDKNEKDIILHSCVTISSL